MLAISDDIKQALVSGEGPYAAVLNAVLDYEKGDWSEVAKYLIMHELKPEAISDSFFDSLRWYNDLMADMPMARA